MTDEEKRFFIKALWESLQDPLWGRDDLIDFGKAIFSKQSLKELPDKTFEKIFPYLKHIAESLGERLTAQAEKQLAAQAKEETKPEPTK